MINNALTPDSFDGSSRKPGLHLGSICQHTVGILVETAVKKSSQFSYQELISSDSATSHGIDDIKFYKTYKNQPFYS